MNWKEITHGPIGAAFIGLAVHCITLGIVTHFHI